MTDLEPYRPRPVSDALQEAGVQVEEFEDGRVRAITFPPELRESYNVLLPVQEIAQAVDMIRPSIRAVQLDPSPDGVHFYNQGTQKAPKLAPRKQALETLALTAGVVVGRTRPLSAAELSAYPEGSIGYEATVMIRRADGTPLELQRSRIWNPEVEHRKVKQAAASWGSNWNKPPSEQEREAEYHRRWNAEKEFGPAKTESKAILRAIRSALQIPHTYTPEQAAKPFIVVGYDLALDYANPDVVRLLLERRPTVEAQVYGVPELPAAEEGPQPPAAGDNADSQTTQSRSESVAEGAPDDTQPSEEPPSASPFKGDEPPEPKAADDTDAADWQLGDGWEGTRYHGKTVADIAKAGDREYLQWLTSDAVSDEGLRQVAAEALAGLEEQAE